MVLAPVRQVIFVIRHKKKWIFMVVLICMALVTSMIEHRSKRFTYLARLSTSNEISQAGTFTSTQPKPLLPSAKNPRVKYIPKKAYDSIISGEIREIVKKQKCQIPKLDPFHPEILPYLVKPFMEGCRIKKYGTVVGDKFYLKVKGAISAVLRYIRRSGDFNIELSEKIILAKSLDTAKIGDECWDSCGKQGGECANFCGKDGFCCRKGFTDCPDHIKADTDYHSCVYDRPIPEARIHSECWNRCGAKGGHCPTFCGHHGYCCRKGYDDCPKNITTDANHHNCIYQWPVIKDLDVIHPIKEEFFQVIIYFNSGRHEEYHYAFLNSQGKGKTDPQHQHNIMLVLFDSVSHAHAERALKKTYKYLKDDPNTVIMRGQTIVGDGTTSQLCAMLTGVSEGELPEARKGFPHSKTVDSWPFIFNKMHELNYKTAFSEEDVYFGMFHYRLHGWSKPPTTHYLRPYWHAMEDNIYKNGISCAHKFNLEYMKAFFDVYRNDNKFIITMSSLLHNKDDRLENLDDDLFEFYKHFAKSDFANNTVIIFGGDHGLRTSSFRATLHGKMEERLPAMFITLPSSFNKYPKLMKNIKVNSNLMTSHFDIYATMRHIMTFPDIPKDIGTKYGKSLFSDISILNRTCKDAGVDMHWCTCLNYETVSTTDNEVKQLTNKVITYINELTKKEAGELCSVLTLKKIIRAGRRTPNAEVNQFAGTITKDGGCDSCEVQLDKSKKFSRFQYEISFSVSPSGGTFEAMGEVVSTGSGSTVTFSKDISRTNLYGNQPDCIIARYPHLRKYCYCTEQT